MVITERERYHQTATFGVPDRAFLLPPWTWQSTLRRWEAEGLSADEDLATCFGTDHELGVPLQMQGPYGPHLVPPLERVALAVTDEHITVRDEEGKAAIEREVLSKVPWLCLQGGYFPQVDHLVPPDVSLENYRYYAGLMRAVVKDPERYLRIARMKGYWESP